MKDIILEVSSLSKIYDSVITDITSEQKDPEIPIGIAPLDNILWGLHRKELMVIGAKPSHGKSSLALQIAYNIADQGRKVWLLSLEMSKEHVISRLLSYSQKIPYTNIRRHSLSESELTRVETFRRLTNEMTNLFICDTVGYTIDSLEFLLEKAIKKPDVVIIDYVQRLKSSVRIKKHEIIEDYLKDYCNLAKRYNFCAIACSQINREGYLKGSGAFEEDADAVLLLNYKRRFESEDKGLDYEIIIDKQRHGEVGLVKLCFEPPIFTMRPMEIWEKDRVKQ